MDVELASNRPRDNPLALLSAPLTFVRGQPTRDPWEISDQRRVNLAQKKHFVIRGTEWLGLAGIRVADLHRSGHAHGLFERMAAFGPGWQDFCTQWGFDRSDGGALGRNIVSEYLSNNQLDRYLDVRNIEKRYFTLYRAVGCVAFLHLVAASWFKDEAKGRGRRRILKEQMGVEYYEDFVFDRMTIEPIIFKIGSLGSAHNEALMGVDWMDWNNFDPAEIRPNPDYVAGFKTAIDLPWTSTALNPVEIVHGLFIDERCADLPFMKRVAAFTGEFFNILPPPVRSGSDFRGPLAGILHQRLLDIRTTS